MQNFKRGNQWFLRDGQILHFYSSVVYSEAKKLLPRGLTFGDEGIQTDKPFDRDSLKIKIIICDTVNSLPHCVLSLQKFYSAETKALVVKLYQNLEEIVPDYSVRLTTDSEGQCLLCGKHLRDLVYASKDENIETTFNCCGFNYDLEESLSFFTQTHIDIEKDKIFVHFHEDAQKTIAEIFPMIPEQIFYISN